MTGPASPADRLRWGCVHSRELLVDELARRGFKVLGNVAHTWRGPIWYTQGSAVTFVEIAIPADFPYLSPTVKPLTAAAARDWVGHEVADYREVQRSWHREPTGRMCLFELEDHTRLPWADPATLLAQLKAWLTEDAAGWPTDEPTLDLERYFHSTGEVLLYGSLDRAVGHVVKLRQDHHGCRLVGSVVPPRRGRRGRTLPWPASSALVLDLGVPSEPVHDWTTLVQAAGANGELLVKAVDRGVRELVLCYQRGHHRGVLALRLTSGGNPWKLRAHIAAPQDPATLVRRSHPQREDLGATLVTVVGVGAIGSVMADLLHRSGVGRLELIDHDYLLPGNAVRHLAGIEHVGKPKVTAVQDVLEGARPSSSCRISTQHDAVRTLENAIGLLSRSDIVVDATADSTATALLVAAASAGAGKLVSVAVLADGQAVRADHWPAPEDKRPAVSALSPINQGGVYEAGCSSPISTTPPAAVWEAAALGTRHVIDELLASEHPAGEERSLQSHATP